MINLEVNNFQSIDQAKVVVDGFTVVLGHSDIGKSAFVRAIKYALTNALGTSFVRHGNQCHRIQKDLKKCRCTTKVVIDLPEKTITWEKGDLISQYTVLDKDSGSTSIYENLDRGTPEFLKEFQRVKVGTNQELVQIPKQFEPIFLLNESGGVVADVLSDLASLGRLNDAADLVSKDKREATSRKKVREEDLAKLRLDSKAYVGVEDLNPEGLQETLLEVETLKESLSKTETFDQKYSSLENISTNLVEVLHNIPPDCGVVLETSNLYAFVSSRLVKQESLSLDLKLLIQSVSNTIPNTATFVDLSTKYYLVSRIHNKLNETLPIYKPLVDISRSQLPVYEPLVGVYKQYSKVCSYINTYTNLEQLTNRGGSLVAKVIPTLSGISTGDLDLVCRYQDSLLRIEQQMWSAQEALAQYDFELTSVLEELEELGVCPFCNQPLGADHSLNKEVLHEIAVSH